MRNADVRMMTMYICRAFWLLSSKNVAADGNQYLVKAVPVQAIKAYGGMKG
jgi:hypothetical protein